MKLIIDISEEDRKDIGNIHFVREDLKFKIGKAIMNGIPLEDVKTEIHEKMADYVASGYADSAEDFEEYSRIVNQAFDNIGNESEVKPNE